MKSEQRIKKSQEFSTVFKRGQSVANRQFVLYTLWKKEQSEFRLGLSVSKKVGNAVTRNRVKRYVRECFRTKQDMIKNQYDYIVIARNPTAKMSYHEVEKSLMHVLKKAKVLHMNNS